MKILEIAIGWVVVVTESEAVTSQVDLFGWATVRLESDNVEHQAEILKAERYGQQWPRTTSLWGTKLAGLFVTWVALSLGAPFWFDLLNMFVNMRAAGKKPEAFDVVRVGESNLNSG